ncbi:energy transducer TonB [Helicobacter kayseriensis]|uniref:energy transducer TonB n=1 Tax=Helicobacter kayseriensis TaxID=2905877 RepID=UPI001E5DF138|nr:energy transducer TonB [Helicobacter kayseriensis]MCE3047009.1 energy transducer TonB [Helicobacter kayseriensis]MCE3048331.1 energy transducer TonB [Helicobacter kayseriensis]
MKILQFLRKKIEAPIFLGFMSALAVYGIGGVWVFGVKNQQQMRIKQDGAHHFVMRLASINNGGEQTQFNPQSSPTPPKKRVQKKHKQLPKKVVTPNHTSPIPPEENTETQQHIASNLTQEGGEAQVLAYNEGVSDEFLSQIRIAISSHNPYPRMARMRKMEGEVVLEFILDVNGDLDGVKILSSTAGDLLNKSAISALHKASKDFPIPPQRVRIKVPIVYSLRT